MALPALVCGWLLAVSAPAVKYSASARTELVVRAPLLTEVSPRDLLEDVLITPRGEIVLYTPRLELKVILEPQLMVRRAFSEPTLETLTFFYLRTEWMATRGLRLVAMESLNYGAFPFDEFRVPLSTPGGGSRMADTSRYIYADSTVGVDVVGIKRTYIGLYASFIVNGLLDAPETPRRRGRAVTPSQVGPEVRALALRALTRRLVGGLSLYGRDVSFSTSSHLSLMQVHPVLQYQFHPLVQGRLEAGAVVGERRPQVADLPVKSFVWPSGEASLSTPVPVGYHWPVQAKLLARYTPFVDAYTTAVYPRIEAGFGLEWKGRRKKQVNLELLSAHSLADGFHHPDREDRVSLKVQWPLTRNVAAVASGRILRLRESLLSDQPLYQWFTAVGLVIRRDDGRL